MSRVPRAPTLGWPRPRPPPGGDGRREGGNRRPANLSGARRKMGKGQPPPHPPLRRQRVEGGSPATAPPAPGEVQGGEGVKRTAAVPPADEPNATNEGRGTCRKGGGRAHRCPARRPTRCDVQQARGGEGVEGGARRRATGPEILGHGGEEKQGGSSAPLPPLTQARSAAGGRGWEKGGGGRTAAPRAANLCATCKRCGGVEKERQGACHFHGCRRPVRTSRRGKEVGEGGKAAEMEVVRERYREQQGGLDTSGVAGAELIPRTGGLGGRICRCGRVCGASNAPFHLPEAQRRDCVQRWESSPR